MEEEEHGCRHAVSSLYHTFCLHTLVMTEAPLGQQSYTQFPNGANQYLGYYICKPNKSRDDSTYHKVPVLALPYTSG